MVCVNVELWTVEINLNDDFASSCAWHIDTLEHRLQSNLQNFICAKFGEEMTIENWILVAVTDSYDKATEITEKLRLKFCEHSGKKPINLF